MVIKVINLDKCIKKFGDIGDIDLTPEITEATAKVQKTAKELAPYDTGDLFRSIHRTIRDKGSRNVTGVVYTTLEYAPYQEFGTVKMEAKPFMRPAMNINRAGIYQSMKKYIRDEIKKKI